MQTVRINVVAFNDGGVWVAQGVEFDITAHAEDISKLPRAFMRAVVENACITQQLGRTPLAGIGPAPERFRRMFDEASTTLGFVDAPPMVSGVNAPEMSMRVAQDA